ncbi:MAG: nucleoside/nucleotide kinase family protein, partial [Lachnospiraceae bacterium]|nr:nucleoside/nucleotide kinase family protein [Lachnospiraceae bacterium]
HTTIRDGKEIPLVKIKGAPVTFDLEKMKKAVKKILSGDICGWPLYDRHRHNPSEDAIKVEKDIVILEGNYLLLNEEGWDELSNLADLTVMIRADLKMIKDRLIKRRIASGHPEEDAEEFVEYSDMYNARLVLEHSGEADLTLFIRADGSYEVYEDKANVL